MDSAAAAELAGSGAAAEFAADAAADAADNVESNVTAAANKAVALGLVRVQDCDCLTTCTRSCGQP